MMTLSKQRKFTFSSRLEDIRGRKCCVIKVRQYMYMKFTNIDHICDCLLLLFLTSARRID